eukprot:12260296-Alexandrium_andersonii.AAC.2
MAAQVASGGQQPLQQCPVPAPGEAAAPRLARRRRRTTHTSARDVWKALSTKCSYPCSPG